MLSFSAARAPALAFVLAVLVPPASIPHVLKPHPASAAAWRCLPPVASACRAVEMTQWVWPLHGSPQVVRAFDPPPRPWMAGHRGVDLAAGAVAGGAVAVRAAGGGVVRFAGEVVSRPLVSIAHSDGLITTYEPVEPAVVAGQPVQAGQVIGRVLPGHPGCPVEACLHWGLRRGEAYLDPLILVSVGRVRLLPLARQAAHRRGGRNRPRCCRSVR
jgi:murein DD-endopeptidase MepM/ murein hydrolase activator NlpD